MTIKITFLIYILLKITFCKKPIVSIVKKHPVYQSGVRCKQCKITCGIQAMNETRNNIFKMISITELESLAISNTSKNGKIGVDF